MTINSTSSKVSLTSIDIAAQKRAELKQFFPEVFCEDKIDFDQLKRVLGDWIEPDKERFGLNWPGKANCMKCIQAPSTGTLRPCRAESVNFDETENVFIEGENLEVLKLLQKAYFGKVKMIYIDPPYNTGNDFIYPDDYKDSLKNYFSLTGQIDDGGRKLTTNTDKSGRYHSNWLNMMYPRLYVARQLLRDDGVIFISIDDHEQENLKGLCNQIFGEENFITQIIWEKVHTRKNSAKYFSVSHDYLIVYAKKISEWNRLLIQRENNKGFSNPDNDERGLWKPDPIYANNYYAANYTITKPDGVIISRPSGKYWRYSEKSIEKFISEDRLIWGKKTSIPMIKRFLFEVQDGLVPVTLFKRDFAGDNAYASAELSQLFGQDKVMSYPKPTKLIQKLLQTTAREKDIVLDFFAGSATIAHAVMKLNAEDGGNRKYICVQIPEPCVLDSEAYKAGYKTIADIAKERIRRAAKKITEENLEISKNLDLGFKVFKLSESNFKIWQNDPHEFNKNPSRQLELNIEHIKHDSSAEDILYELLLKDGFSLATMVEKKQFAGRDVYSVENDNFLICLDKNITPQLIDAMAEVNPSRVICLDIGFRGHDQLKVNTAQTFKTHQPEIIFRTV